MFFEFLNAVISLDLNWLAGLFFNNLHYLFAFAAVCFFFWEPSNKKLVIAFILISLDFWVWADFEVFSGWGIFVGGFLSLYYISKIALLTFAHDIPQLKKYFVVISTIQALAALVIFNIFLS